LQSTTFVMDFSSREAFPSHGGSPPVRLRPAPRLKTLPFLVPSAPPFCNGEFSSFAAEPTPFLSPAPFRMTFAPLRFWLSPASPPVPAHDFRLRPLAQVSAFFQSCVACPPLSRPPTASGSHAFSPFSLQRIELFFSITLSSPPLPSAMSPFLFAPLSPRFLLGDSPS